METDKYSEEEIQALIVGIELADPIETPNNNHYSFYPKNATEAKNYFCGYSLDVSNDIIEQLGKKGFFDETQQLTEKGKNIAGEVRFLRPPIYYWYRKYYAAIEKSRAFADFNREVYGLDIDQFGFSDINQINKLMELMNLDEKSICLDIGCGNGRIAEYISNKTGSAFICIDNIPEAIDSARRRTMSDSLIFQRRHIDDITSESRTFDAIMSIDSIFYGRSYDKIFADLKLMLKHDGVLVFITSEDDDIEACLSKQFQYEKYDFTEDCFRAMKQKNKVMEKYEEQFREESNYFIWKQYMAESLDETIKEIPNDFTRFIYQATPKM